MILAQNITDPWYWPRTSLAYCLGPGTGPEYYWPRIVAWYQTQKWHKTSPKCIWPNASGHTHTVPSAQEMGRAIELGATRLWAPGGPTLVQHQSMEDWDEDVNEAFWGRFIALSLKCSHRTPSIYPWQRDASELLNMTRHVSYNHDPTIQTIYGMVSATIQPTVFSGNIFKSGVSHIRFIHRNQHGRLKLYCDEMGFSTFSCNILSVSMDVWSIFMINVSWFKH